LNKLRYVKDPETRKRRSKANKAEALRFLARVLDGEPMTEVCRDFGISRKTGYKIFDRYKEHGLEALSDRSRRPVRFANQLPAQLETRIVAIMFYPLA
jgi:transposase